MFLARRRASNPHVNVAAAVAAGSVADSAAARVTVEMVEMVEMAEMNSLAA